MNHSAKPQGKVCPLEAYVSGAQGQSTEVPEPPQPTGTKGSSCRANMAGGGGWKLSWQGFRQYAVEVVSTAMEVAETFNSLWRKADGGGGGSLLAGRPKPTSCPPGPPLFLCPSSPQSPGTPDVSSGAGLHHLQARSWQERLGSPVQSRKPARSQGPRGIWCSSPPNAT